MNTSAAIRLFENLAYYAIKATKGTSKEKGAYPAFKVPNGKLVNTSHVVDVSDRWKQLAADVYAKYGIRNEFI